MSKYRKKDSTTNADSDRQDKSIWYTTIAVWIISSLMSLQAYQIAILLVYYAMIEEDSTSEYHLFWGTFWFLIVSIAYAGLLTTVRNQLLRMGSSAPKFTLLHKRVKASIYSLQFITYAGNMAAVVLWYLNPDKPRLEPLTVMFLSYAVGIVYFQNRIWKPIDELHKQNQVKEWL
jgi:uncharacterized membrane protein